MQATLYSDIDVDKLSFRPPRRLKNGQQRCDIRRVDEKGNSRPNNGIQTCRFSRCFVRDFKDEKNGSGYVRWVLSVPLDADVPHVAQFRSFMDRLDDKAVEHAQQNCLEWFKKQHSPDFLRGMYYSPVKAEECYSDKLKCTLPVRDGCCDFDIYDEDGEQQTLETFLEKAGSSEVVLVIDLDKVWFADRAWGVCPTVRCIVYFPSTGGHWQRPTFVPVPDAASGVLDIAGKRDAPQLAHDNDAAKRAHVDDEAKHALAFL